MAAQSRLNPIQRLQSIHSNLSRLHGSNNELLKASGFDDQLTELADTLADFRELAEIINDANAVSEALSMLLILFEAAHAKSLNGGGLGSLLSPQYEKLRGVIDRLENCCL